MASQPIPRLTEEEYLRIERAASYKSEFVGGEMFAMAGGTPRHSMLEANASRELGHQLRRTRCRVCSSNMRFRTPVTGDELYPDISVICGPVQLYPGSTDILVNPTVVVEVLSPSTANYDRGLKFELYRQFPTLRDYVIIHQKSIYIEHHSRQSDNAWLLREYRGPDARVLLASIECELHLGSVYEDLMEEPSLE